MAVPPERVRGLDDLAAFIGAHGRLNADVARVLGVSNVTVSNWFAGDDRPVALYRHMLERWTSGLVCLEAWLTDEEKERIARVVPLAPPPSKRRKRLPRSSSHAARGDRGMSIRISPQFWCHGSQDCLLADCLTGLSGFYPLELCSVGGFNVAVKQTGPWWRFAYANGYCVGPTVNGRVLPEAETWILVPDGEHVADAIARGRRALGIAAPASATRLRKAVRSPSPEQRSPEVLIALVSQNRRVSR